MAKTLDRNYLDGFVPLDRFTLLPVPPEMLTTKWLTLAVFSAIIAGAPKNKQYNPIRVATNLVKNAYWRELLSWNQLATLLLHNVQYIELYIRMVIGPTSLVDDLINPDGTEREPDPLKVRACEVKFINRLRYIAKVLDGTVVPPRLGSNYELEGKSLSYWLQGGHVRDKTLSEDAVARAYEKELQYHPLFRRDFELLMRMFNVPSWRYTFATNRFSAFDANYCRSKELSSLALTGMFVLIIYWHKQSACV